MNNQPTNQYQQGTPNPHYQPQYGAVPGYTTQVVNYPILQQTPISPFAHRSPWLLGFGVLDVMISGIMFVWTIGATFKWNTTISIFVTMPCAMFHLILGIVSILGSRDGIRYRGCLIASLVMGIVGPCVFVCATLTTDIIEWISRISECRNCFYYNDNCPICYTYETAIFAFIIAYAVIQAIVSVVLSSISCCNLCRCCGCCYSGESSQPLLYTSAPPPYVTLAVPQSVPHNVPTASGGVAEPTQPNYKK